MIRLRCSGVLVSILVQRACQPPGSLSYGRVGGATGSRDGHARRPSPLLRPVVIDLFAGAGGLSLGLEQAGFDGVTAVEYDAVHAATHSFNFPLTKVLC